MTSERFRFLNNLKAEATKNGKIDILDPVISTTRPDVSPVPFSKHFTEDDLSRMGEIISDSDEEPFLAPRISLLHSTNTNGDSPASSELHAPASHILQSSLQACGGGFSNDTGNNDIAFSSSHRFCEKPVNLTQKTQEKHPEPVESNKVPLLTNISGTVQGNLPKYSFYDPILAAHMPESPLLLQSTSSINMPSSLCESPNYGHLIAQQIDQLGCTESPAPTPVTLPVVSPEDDLGCPVSPASTPTTLPVVSPDDNLGCAESTAPTPATLPVGLPDEQLLGCPAPAASTPTTLPVVSPDADLGCAESTAPTPATLPVGLPDEQLLGCPAPAASTPTTLPVVSPDDDLGCAESTAPTPATLPVGLPDEQLLGCPAPAASTPTTLPVVSPDADLGCAESTAPTPATLPVGLPDEQLLGCSAPAASTPTTLPVVSPDDDLGCAESTAPTPATLPVGLPDEQLLGCSAPAASTPTTLPVVSPVDDLGCAESTAPTPATLPVGLPDEQLLGCSAPAASTPTTLPVVSPDDDLGCAESTAPTPATLPVGLPDEQLLGCPASPASTPTLLPIGSPGISGNNSEQLEINDREPSKKRRCTNKKDKGRLRLVHKNQWLDIKRKNNRNSGKPYTGRDGKLRKKREMGPACGDKCIFKCSQKISDFERDLQFVAFWSLGELVRHWDFINRYCDKIPKRRFTCEAPTRREFTIRYYLPTGVGTENLPRIEEPKIRVCKTMFLNTLGIKQGMVYSALNKLSIQGTVLKDNRGRHPNHKKVITEEMITSVCDHVNTFIPVESHYVRERTSKLYLDGTLSFARMFLLYQEWYDPKNQKKVMTARQYTDIVNEKINLGFHVPKKDQCDVCHVFKNLPRPVTEEQMRNYMTHIRNKTIARELKNKDKESSGKRSEVLSAVYDFQKVHGMPCAETSILYYKRKLTVFNFTIFEMGSRVAKCYVWDESTAKRGAIEVSSCLYDFIREHHQKCIKFFNFWSDNCGGQNRNRIVFASYLRAAKDFQVTITHKYFEKGHTQNEGDSVHALIERTAKNKMVYTPDQWFALIRWAKQDGNPYIVKEMGTSDFFDFKTLLSGCNWKMNTDRERVFWSQIRQLEILPDESNKIHYKTNFCDHEFKTIIVENTLETPRTRRIRNRRENNLLLAPLSRPLIKAYMGKLPIPQAKLQDLKYLCQTNIIPSIYHEFYNNLIEGCDIDVDESSEEDEAE